MNPFIIEQTQDETKLAFEVHQNAAINRIRLARAKVASQAIDEAPEFPLSVSFSFKSRPLDAPPKVLRLEIAFRMAGVQDKVSTLGQEEKRADPVVSVECDYEVDYLMRDEFQLSAQHVRAFKDGNAIFNTWPYFREYLQSSLQRMGLPPLVAPFLRLQPKTKLRSHVDEAVSEPKAVTRRPKREGD